MRTALRNRLARLERRHSAPHPTDDFKHGIGLSALLASMPPHEPDASWEGKIGLWFLHGSNQFVQNGAISAPMDLTGHRR